MKRKLIKLYCLLFIPFLVLLYEGCAEKKYNNNDVSINSKSLDSIVVINDRVKKLTPLLLPDTSASSNGVYSGIGDFCFVPPDKIFYLDTYYYKIKAISSESGKELFSFGNRGAGPGEFQPQPSLKYINHYGILTIDHTQLRITLFEDQGQIKETLKIKFVISDFIFLNDSTVLTGSIMLMPDYKPLRIISLKSEKIISEFGSIVEPQEKIIKKINASSFSRGKQGFYSRMSMISLLLLPNGTEVIYSQSQPYALYKYNLKDHSYIRFNANLPFSTLNNMILEFDEGRKIASSEWKPSGTVMSPQLFNNKIIVPIFSQDALTNYLDVYSLSGNFEKRFSIPPFPGLHAFKSAFSHDGKELYVLVGNENRLFWIERFKIDPSVYK
jgi:hypothetical protein